MPTILLAERVSAGTLEQIRTQLPAGVTLAGPPGPAEEELIQAAAQADAMLVVTRPITAAVLSGAPRLRLVQFLGAGFDSVELEAARTRGVMVGNAPGANAAPVAEQAILLMLALLKRFRASEQATRDGRWPKAEMMQAGLGDLCTATVGLVGLGHIGRAVAERLRPFGSRVLYTTRHRLDAATEERLGVSYTALAELLGQSTIVSLHLPLSAETQGMIGEAELARMRPGALLINAARGGLVDEAALRRAIESGHLGGAGLDVLVTEPPGANPFADLPNVVVTPHTGGASSAAVQRILRMVVVNLKSFFAGERPPHLVS